MHADAVVSSKGQVTLPTKIRAELGIQTGTKLHFELRGKEIVITAELPVSSYRGILKNYDVNIADFEITEEIDRELE
jgi:AbrB family looped-hinge helix DNA binding protein